MASFNLTIEDSSPLIAYSPAGSWVDTPTDDPFAASYSGASYHISTAPGATATITFTGTGLSIFGGHRSSYGTYSISVDGQTISSGSSQSNNPSSRQLLGSASALTYGTHTAVLTSTGGGPIDIDWVDFNARVGPPGSVGVKKNFDDNDSMITYQPSAADWQSNSNPAFFGGTLRFSQTPGASASLTFSGDAVALYGTVSPDHADISISVDGQEQRLPGGAGLASVVHPQVLLYYRGNLGGGEHTIVLSGDRQPNTGPFIDLDFVDVFTVSVPPGASSTPIVTTPTGAAASDQTVAPVPSSSPTTSLVSSSRMPIGTIAGAVIGGLLALLLLLGFAAFLLLRRRRRQSTAVEKSVISVSPSLPMQREPKAMEAGYQDGENPYGGIVENPVFPLPPGQKQASLRHSIAPSYYSNPSFAGHSRELSNTSVNSSTPLVPSVPRLSIPKPRSIPRKAVPGRSGLNVSHTPTRPSNRPPTLDFTYMESPS